MHVPHRRATDKEQLHVQQLTDYPQMKGLYPKGKKPLPAGAKPATGCDKLVCVKGRTEAIIKQVRFEPGVPLSLRRTYEGKRNVDVTLFRRWHQDTVRFLDGRECTLTNLMSGVRIDIGIPVKKRVPKAIPAGIAVVNNAIREAMALPPDPKPGEQQQEDDAGEPREPAPAREPAPDERQPEPAKSTAKSRSRYYAKSK
jgi:hypothetical protein